MGICLGHQIIGQAAGATTTPPAVRASRRQPPGQGPRQRPRRHHQPEPRVPGRAGPALDASGFDVSHVSLNDGSVEGLRHRELPVFSVQFHPEGCPGPQDSQPQFDHLFELIAAASRQWSACASSKPDTRKVLVIGSGPIVIGQAAEFDYAGTQACRALREEGCGPSWSTRTRPRS